MSGPKVTASPRGAGGTRRVSETHRYPQIELPPADGDEREPASNDDLGRALKPAIEGVILETLRENPKVVINLVYPVLGKAIRKAIGAALAGMAASIEQKATSALTLQGLRWRWQALRSKQSYAEIVMANSLIYSVEDILLIHRGTGILLLHESNDVHSLYEHDLISGMLTAVEDFMRDSWKKDADLAVIGMDDDTTMVVKSSPLAVVAASVKGTVTTEVHHLLEELIEEIHLKFRRELEEFDGGTNVFETALPTLEKAIVSNYSRKIPGQNKDD